MSADLKGPPYEMKRSRTRDLALASQCLVDERLKRCGNRSVRVLLHHHDRDEPFLRIDPEVGAVNPAPPVLALRTERLCGGKVGHDAEPETESDTRSEQQAGRRQVAGMAG